MQINATSSNQINNKNNNITFKASPKTLGAKVMKAFEFDEFNFSTAGLCGICYGAVFGVRYLKSRDEMEKKEILRRDLATITAIIFGRRAVQNIVSRLCTKKTGLALHIKPENHKKTLQKVFNYLRPDKGIKVLSSSEITEKYSNIHQYKNGIVGFAKFITKEGGDIKKVLTTDKQLAKNLQNVYSDWQKINKKNYEMATSQDIYDMLVDVTSKDKNNKNIKEMEEFFKNKDNTLVKKAKSLNSTFDFLTTFGFIPVVLGFVLPYFNEQATKKALKKSQ